MRRSDLGISVTIADPGVVSGSIDAVKSICSTVHVLCGAGVKNGKDIAKSIEFGADGVLLASGVDKASDIEAVLRDLASGIYFAIFFIFISLLAIIYL